MTTPPATSGAHLADIASGSLVSRFLSGAGFAASGIAFALRNKKILAWAVVPMVIQWVLTVGIAALGLREVNALVERFGPEEGHWYSFVSVLMVIGLAVGIVLAASVAGVLLTGVVCDPIYDLISEATEEELVGRAIGEPFSVARAVSGIVRELGITVVRLSVYLAVAVPLWILGLTGVGSIVAAPLGLMWTWAFVALEGLSRSQARHALAARDRLGAIRGHTAVSLGFGALGWLLAFVPFTAPLLVVGGTRLFLALAAHDRVPSALTDAEKARLRA